MDINPRWSVSFVDCISYQYDTWLSRFYLKVFYIIIFVLISNHNSIWAIFLNRNSIFANLFCNNAIVIFLRAIDIICNFSSLTSRIFLNSRIRVTFIIRFAIEPVFPSSWVQTLEAIVFQCWNINLSGGMNESQQGNYFM